MKNKLFILLLVLTLPVFSLRAQNKTVTAISHSLWDTVPDVSSYVPPVRQWLSVRGSVQLRLSGMEGGVEVNYFAVLAKDSLLYLHVSKYGIELGRMLCSADSLTLLMHTSQSYWKGDYSLLYNMTGIPLNFKMLQDLLLLSPDLPGKSVDTNGFLTSTRWMVKDTVPLFTVHYSRYENVGKDSLVYYPLSMRVLVPEPEVDVLLSHRAVKVEVPGPTSLKIPEKYTRTKLIIK